MRIPGGNHLDRQKTLLPRDYLECPEEFGAIRGASFAVPPGGDAMSLDVARLQHELVVIWRTSLRPPSLTMLARRFGMSKASLSRIATGKRWMGDVGATVLVYAARHPSSMPTRPTPTAR